MYSFTIKETKSQYTEGLLISWTKKIEWDVMPATAWPSGSILSQHA